MSLADINECLTFPDLCEGGGQCIDTEGSFLCQCPHGLTLDQTGMRCVGEQLIGMLVNALTVAHQWVFIDLCGLLINALYWNQFSCECICVGNFRNNRQMYLG